MIREIPTLLSFCPSRQGVSLLPERVRVGYRSMVAGGGEQEQWDQFVTLRVRATNHELELAAVAIAFHG